MKTLERPTAAGTALWRDEVVSPRTAQASVAVLGIIAAASFNRSFTSPDYLYWVIPALAIGATVAVTFGRKALGLSFVGLAVGGLLTLPVLFARDLTVAGLPTPSGLSAALALIAKGLSGMLHEAAPVPVEMRFSALLWVAGLLLGFLGGSWIVVRRPIGAVVTALMVVGYAGQVGIGPSRDIYGAAAMAATIVFFLSDGRHRLASWGRDPKPLPAYVGIPTLIVVCAAAIISPAYVGARRPIVDLKGGLQPRLVIIKPLSDVKRQLDIKPPIEVMRVTSNSSAYWRLTSLDSYKGNEWVLEAEPVKSRNGPQPAPSPPTRGRIIEQDVTLTSLLAPWLPSAFAATSVDSPVGFEIDPVSSTLLTTQETQPGLHYKVVSKAPATDKADPTLKVKGWKPDNTERSFGRAASQVIGNAQPGLPQAIALEDYFRKFTYDDKVEGGHSVDRLDSFLRARRGYCEQFAATMTLMLRGLGINARVAVGFLPGALKGQEHVVSTQDAHAWVEASIPGYGWVTLDPTPGRGEPQGARQQFEQPAATPTPQPAPAGGATPTPEPTAPAPANQSTPTTPSGGRFPFVSVILAVFVIGFVPGAKAMRSARRRKLTGGAGALAAWDELLDAAADLGLRRQRSETPWEFVARTGNSAPALTVVSAAVSAIYGPDSPTPAEVTASWAALKPATAALRSGAPMARRWTAIFNPGTLVGTQTRARIRGAVLRPWKRRTA